MTPTIQSVERAFSVLESFDGEHPTRSAAEIAELTGLSRPTTYRLLHTLQAMGYIVNDKGRFTATPKVLRLSAGALGPTSLASRAQPVLDELSESVGEHVALGVLDGDSVVTLAASTSPRSRFLSIAVQVGRRLPADRTSLGRVLDAYRTEPGSPSDPGRSPQAAAETEAIRRAGHVVTDGLLESGLRSIGVPVRNTDGDVVAAISVAVNASSMTFDELRDRCLPEMLRAAERLSARI